MTISAGLARKIRGNFDLTIIGGGIVGLATARQVALKHPKLKLCVIDKEKELASHQSKRNSGVVHCGLYYRKNSLKSKFCIKGAHKIKQYCQEKKLPYIQCGKLVVATRKDELDTLYNLFDNGKANEIEGIQMLNSQQVQKIQPGCSRAIEAIWAPTTAIVDWQQIALSYASEFVQRGGTVITEFVANKFVSKDKTILIQDGLSGDFIQTKSAVNSAGLYSDYFARQTGNNEHPKIIPFKGSYYTLSDRLSKTIKTNIYPVPNPKLPFLGVHITPRTDGSVLVGPTSLLTLGYEKYSPETPLRLLHMYHILVRSGLRKMLKNRDYQKAGMTEIWRYLSKTRFSQDAQEFLPDLKTVDLLDTKFCGIRAQAMGRDGELVDDFLFESGVYPEFNKILHLRNCPSPAATSSLAIAERVVNILEERWI